MILGAMTATCGFAPDLAESLSLERSFRRTVFSLGDFVCFSQLSNLTNIRPQLERVHSASQGCAAARFFRLRILDTQLGFGLGPVPSSLDFSRAPGNGRLKLSQ